MVGAWRSAPLLPWGVQCPVRVCAALVAGSGGSGRYLVLCLSCFPLPAARVPRCAWRAVPSGCPLPLLAGTPFHAVCAFRELGPVALLVVPACPLRVCALALPQRPLPPPLGGVACAPHAAPALGAGRGVPLGLCPSACPAPVSCSVWRAWGGGGPVPGPPYLARGCAPPVGRVRGVRVRGGGLRGGGRPVRHAPRLYGRGGQKGGGSPCLVPSLCLPWAGSKAGVTGILLVMGGVVPIPSGSCSPAFSGRDLCGVLVRWRGLVCSPRFLWEPAAMAGGRAVLRLPSRAGGGGTIPPASWGGGRRPRGLRDGGGGGGGGLGRVAASLLPLWGAARGSLPWPPSCRWRTPPQRARSVGVAGPPWGGGGEGRPVNHSPGGPF